MKVGLIVSICAVTHFIFVDYSSSPKAATLPFEIIHGDINIQAFAGRMQNDVELYLGQTGSCYDLSKYSSMLGNRKIVKCAYGSDTALDTWNDGQNSEYVAPSLGPEFGTYIEIYFEHGIAEEIRVYNVESEYDASALLKVGITWLGRPSYEDSTGYYWVSDRRIHLISVFLYSRSTWQLCRNICQGPQGSTIGTAVVAMWVDPVDPPEELVQSPLRVNFEG